MRKSIGIIAALALALTALAPVANAEARDGRGYYGRGYDRHYDRGYNHRRHRDNDGDAVAAGAVGLILGLAIGSLASQPRSAPPPRRSDYYAPPPSHYGGSYGGSAYERDYGYAPQYYEPPIRTQCRRAERRWDSYAGRYVVIDVPC